MESQCSSPSNDDGDVRHACGGPVERGPRVFRQLEGEQSECWEQADASRGKKGRAS